MLVFLSDCILIMGNENEVKWAWKESSAEIVHSLQVDYGHAFGGMNILKRVVYSLSITEYDSILLQC